VATGVAASFKSSGISRKSFQWCNAVFILPAEGCGLFCNFKFISLKLLGFYVQLFRRRGADETILLRHETIFPFSCRRPETIANLQFFPTKRRKAANWEIVNAERRSHQ
jgi:hypothetical protein